jgi:hypothetical protein
MMRSKANRVIGLLILTIAFAISTFAENATIKIVNKSKAAITVSIDGTYGCRAESGDTCTFAATAKSHTLKAVRNDNNQSVELKADVASEGYTWKVTDDLDWNDRP